jgi:hypothetical protein
MTKQAHITSRPDHQVGDKVLGLCGKKWKVTVLWEDLPRDKPICRDCVDNALGALTEADEVIERTRMEAMLVGHRMRRLTQVIDPDEDLLLDVIAAEDREYRSQLEEKQRVKAERKRAKHACSCTWKTMEDFVVDPECPIHGQDEPDASEDKGDG